MSSKYQNPIAVQALEELLQRAQRAELTAEEKVVLEGQLSKFPEAREIAVDLMMDEAILEDSLASLQMEEVTGDRRRALFALPSIPSRDRSKRSAFIRGLAAVAMLLFGFFLGDSGRSRDRIDSSESTMVAAPQPIAELVRGVDISFERTTFDLGRHKFDKGIAELRFRSDVNLVIEAPADFTILDDKKMQLREGRLRALVGEGGKGFEVVAPDVGLVDLGTEFGLTVTPGQSTDVHVFSGEVELSDGQSLLLAREGYAARWKKGRQEETFVEPDDKGFESPASLQMREARAQWDAWLADPATLLCYDFSGKGNQVINLAKPGLANGTIKGPRRVSGRTDDETALLFDQEGDHVAINLPDIPGSATFSAWIWPEIPETSQGAILNSAGFEPGDLHWQVTRNASVRGGAHSLFEMVGRGGVLQFGQWNHVALVIDRTKAKCFFYINGTVVSYNWLMGSQPLLPGLATLGDWLEPNGYPQRRGFRGRIAQLVISGRAIDHEEMKTISQRGAPKR